MSIQEKLRNPPVMSMAVNEDHLTRMWIENMQQAADRIDHLEDVLITIRDKAVDAQFVAGEALSQPQ